MNIKNITECIGKLKLVSERIENDDNGALDTADLVKICTELLDIAVQVDQARKEADQPTR